MPPLGLLGIDNTAVNLALNVTVISLVAIWFATIYWTYADARRRILDPMLIGCATVGSFVFPFIGALVYMIVRPPEFLEDAHERDLEMQAVEARLYATGLQLCPGCNAAIERDFLRCPSCMRRLKEPCRSCKRPLEPSWQVCPYCEVEIGKADSRRSRRRRQPSAKAKPDKPAVTEAPPPA